MTGTVDGYDISASGINWDTAYTDRLKWDGGATGLVAATGRTSLELVIGQHVQAYNSNLTAINQALTTTSGPTFDNIIISNAITMADTKGIIWPGNLTTYCNGTSMVVGVIRNKYIYGLKECKNA